MIDLSLGTRHNSGGKPTAGPLAPSSFEPVSTISALPFVLTFAAVFFIAWNTLYSLLSGHAPSKISTDFAAPRRRSRGLARITSALSTCVRQVLDCAPAITFSVTVGLSAVLAELIFCEISGLLQPLTRRIALETTISILLVLLVVIIPALEIHSITSAASWRFSGLRTRARVLAWGLDILGLIAWLTTFWWVGRAILGGSYVWDARNVLQKQGLSRGSLERIGIIGITLMASLAGFAAVSSLWQTWGVRVRHITESDIARKQTGLDATTDLLSVKEARLRALEHKVLNSPKSPHFAARVLSSLRGSAETHELAALRLEISGLEAMQNSLSQTVRVLRSRRDAQKQAATPVGRVCLGASYIFSIYCIYRIIATSIATIRRWWRPRTFAAGADPITQALSLIAQHWDPNIDRDAWSRQISFLLAGLMLLASFNAVLQTVVLFSRLTPKHVLQSAQANFALLVSQITATYVVSSALLLRSNLPKEMSSVIEEALGAPLDTAFVERWFEGWFLGACVVTALGILVGRKVVGSAEWEEELGDEDVELGKRS